MKNRKVFVGNLDFETTEEEVRDLLIEFGTIVNLKYNKKKGFAIIEFKEPIEAQNAIKVLNGQLIKDRKIRVSPEVRSSKAKSMTIYRYKETGKNIANKKSLRNRKKDTQSQKP